MAPGVAGSIPVSHPRQDERAVVRSRARGDCRSVAQLVEHRSPKPAVGGSIPSGPVWNHGVSSPPAPSHVSPPLDGRRLDPRAHGIHFQEVAAIAEGGSPPGFADYCVTRIGCVHCATRRNGERRFRTKIVGPAILPTKARLPGTGIPDSTGKCVAAAFSRRIVASGASGP